MTFTEKLKRFFTNQPSDRDYDIEALEDMLIESDFGAREAQETAELLKTKLKKENPREALKSILLTYLAKAKPAAPLPPPSENVITIMLLLGVNGVGKTTTAAKLAKLHAAYHPILAAADTFRAGAIDQLKIHGERLNLRVISHKSGADPAAVVFDAVHAARASGSRLVIADTAGRMHTKKDLIQELQKIEKSVKNADNDSGNVYLRRYLTLDATTGRNVISQAEVFNDAIQLDGVILTKTDSGAKGGAIFTLASRFALPVVYRCSGENYDDIAQGVDISAFFDL